MQEDNNYYYSTIYIYIYIYIYIKYIFEKDFGCKSLGNWWNKLE